MEVIVRRIKSDELYHHGEEGQKWGVRHGPPYPLDPSPAKQAIRKKKSKGLLTTFKNKRKGKMLRKAKEAKKKEREENEAAIKSADSNKVLQRVSKMSDDELRSALTRIELAESIKNLKSEKNNRRMKTGQSALETAAKTLGTIATAAEAAGKVRGVMEKFGVVKPVKPAKDANELMKDLADFSNNELKKTENEFKLQKIRDKDPDYLKGLIGGKNSGISDDDFKKKLEKFGLL